MATETEKKYRLPPDRVDELVGDLNDMGAEFCGEDDEVNTIFGGGQLEVDKAALRIRTTQSGATLTYKRRIPNDRGVKEQIEYEVVVDDPVTARAMIESLGFLPGLVYEKHRRKWRFRDVEVVIDQLPFGLYMEIEGPVMSIAEAEMLLGADELEVVHETYPWLTSQMGKRVGNVVEARFEEGDKDG